MQLYDATRCVHPEVTHVKRPMFELILTVLKRNGGTYSYYLKTLGGGSLRLLSKRLFRLRGVAKGMAMADPAPPFPVRLQVETTDICNLKCVMCTREILSELNTRSISLDEFVKVVDAIEPYYVTMNGLGEPLFDETIFEKLAYLRQKGISSSMPTNGTLVRHDKLEKLAMNLPDILQLSIDGASRETFEEIRKAGNFSDVLANFRAICQRRAEGKSRRGTTIGIECALQRQNLFEFREMYALYSGLPNVDSFGLVPVFNFDPEGKTFADIMPSVDEVRELHRRLDVAIKTTMTPKERVFYEYWRGVSAPWIEERGGYAVKPNENRHACVVPWYNVYVDAKGRVYPCCFLIATEQVMGNIFEEPFHNIWTGVRYREFRDRIVRDRPNLIGCRTCPRNDDSRIRQIKRLRFFIS